MPDSPITHITEDIVQVQIPLPYALKIVNCYLLRGASGWTMIDSGLNTEPAQIQWKAAFNELNIKPQSIEKIIITHMHPDHFGMAGWIQSLLDNPMPVYYPIGEERQTKMFFGSDDTSEFYHWLIMCGMPHEMAREVAGGMTSTRNLTKPYPIEPQHIHPEESLQLGERTFKTIHAPGHSDGQLMLYDESDKLLLSGDHVLMKITPNIGSWPQAEADPLGRFIQSLTDLQTLDVRLALPGHKWLIEDWQGRLQELIEHHEARLIHTCIAVEQGAQTVYDIAHKVFAIMRFTTHEWRFAMAETLAHLDLLEKQGKVTYEGAPVRCYQLI